MGGLVSPSGDHRTAGADRRGIPAAFEGAGRHLRPDHAGAGAAGGVRTYVEHPERNPKVYAESRSGPDFRGISGADRRPARLVLRRGICTSLLPCAFPGRGDSAGGIRRAWGVYCGRLAFPGRGYIEIGAGSDLL